MTAYSSMDRLKENLGSVRQTPNKSRRGKIGVAPADDQTSPDHTSTYTPTSPKGSPSLALAKDQQQEESEPMKKSAVAGDVCNIFSVFFALFVRVVLGAFCLFTVYLVVHQKNDLRYWGLASLNVFLVVEGVYTIVTRLGHERKWICLCFMCYLVASVPSICILELERLNDFEAKYANASADVSISVAGVSANIKLDPDLALNITEQCLVFLLILCRWLLPRGDISRDQLSQLLFVFIGMASDVMELFQLFDETEVRQDRPLTYAILAVWTLSLFQFSLVLTMSQNPKKSRVAKNLDSNSNNKSRSQLDFEDNGTNRNSVNKLTYTEMWSLVVTILMQDGPFLTTRLYVLISHNLINYSIIFFTCKNVLVVMLLLYRFLVICLKKMEEDDDDDDDDDDDRNKRSHRHRHRSMGHMNGNVIHPVDTAINDPGVGGGRGFFTGEDDDDLWSPSRRSRSRYRNTPDGRAFPASRPRSSTRNGGPSFTQPNYADDFRAWPPPRSPPFQNNFGQPELSPFSDRYRNSPTRFNSGSTRFDYENARW